MEPPKRSAPQITASLSNSSFNWADSSWITDTPECTAKPLGRDDCCRIRGSLLGKRYRLVATGSVRSAEPAKTRIDSQQENPPPEVACLDRGKYVRISRLWQRFLPKHKHAIPARTNAAIAQLVERIHGKDEVSGSSPDRGSKKFFISWQSTKIKCRTLLIHKDAAFYFSDQGNL